MPNLGVEIMALTSSDVNFCSFCCFLRQGLAV
jgi:hypothetical protein